MRQWECEVCGFVYDEEEGFPEHGIEPGTSWDEVSDDWECPHCGATKDQFNLVK